MSNVFRHLQSAARRLWRRRTASAAVVLTIGLVTGAGASVAAFINAALVRPLPYPEADRLVSIFTLSRDNPVFANRTPLRSLDILRFRERLRRADRVEGAWAEDRVVSAGSGEPVSVPAARVSPGFLDMLGGRPHLGRFWSVEEDLGNARVCALSHGVWMRQFGGDPTVIGRTIIIDREPYEVVAVLQQGFRPSRVPSEIWTPLVLRMEHLPNPRSAFIAGFGRLAPGASLESLEEEVKSVLRDLERESPATHAGDTGGVVTLRYLEFGEQRTAALILGLAIASLGLIAIANLASVRLARAIGDRGDAALRIALGASAGDLLRAEIAEASMLSVVGSTLGLALAALAMPLLRAIDPITTAAIGDVPLDGRVVVATLLMAILIAFLSGVVPIWREARRSLTEGLGASGRRTSASRGETRTRRVLVALEAGLALVLLVAAAVFGAALNRVAHRSVGFDSDRLLVGQIRTPAAVYPTTEARGVFIRSVLEHVRAVPGVAQATTTLNPFVPGGGAYVTAIRIDGRPRPDGLEYTASFRRVSDEYFSTLGVPIVRGRPVGSEDRIDTQPVAVVSETFARTYWPDADPLGQRILRNTTAFTVVGIAGDIQDTGAGSSSSASLFYIPFAQNSAALSGATLVVRAIGDPWAVSSAVRAAVLAADPNQPLEKVTTLEGFYHASLGPDRLRGSLLGLLALLGLALTGIGIYGVTSCMVEERTTELGVRLVLGASPAELFRRVVGGAGLTVMVGCLAGGAVAALIATALDRLLPALTTGATPSGSDLWAVAPAVLALTAIGLFSASVPARRAARADPREVLR